MSRLKPGEHAESHVNAPEKSSFASRGLFLWILPLLRLGHKRSLKLVDIYAPSKDTRVANLAAKLHEALQLRHGNLLWALYDTFRSPFIGTLVCQALGDVCVVTAAFLLRFVLLYATAIYHGDSSERWKGIGSVMAIFILQLISSGLINHAEYKSHVTGAQARAAAELLIFKKSVGLSGRAQHGQGFDRGFIMNLATFHAGNLSDCSQRTHMFCAQLIGVILAIGLMTVNLWYSPLVGFAPLIISYAITVPRAGRMLQSYRKKAIEITVGRTNLLLSTLGGIHYVKYFAWEPMFLTDISKLRWAETYQYRKILGIDMGDYALGQVLTGMVPLIIFITWRETEHSFEATRIFSSLALMNVIKENITSLGINKSHFSRTLFSIHQLSVFFNAEERQRSSLPSTSTALHKATFTWEAPTHNGVFQLTDLSIEFPPGLTAVVGSVGSGKSSLLDAIVGEMRQTSGNSFAPVQQSYCSQKPWIQSATLRENVVFGRDFNEDWYWQVIYACALEKDLDLLADRDLTQIGERGINISGGQMQRVELARAIYSNCDLIVIDDALSAVDANVSKHIFKHAIKGLLRQKCVIMATHQLQLLPESDYVVWLQDGRVAFQGSYTRTPKDLRSQICAETSDVSAHAVDGSRKCMIGNTEHKSSPSYIQNEDRAFHHVKFKIIADYILATGSLWNFPLLVAWSLISQGLVVFTGVWLAWWVSNKYNALSAAQYIAIYLSLTLLAGVFPFGFAWTTSIVFTRASNKMAQAAFERIFRAPTSFFDSQPLGRIISRFTGDVTLMDDVGPLHVKMLTQEMCTLLSIFVLVSVYYPYFAPVLVPLYCCSAFIALYVQSTSRELRRLSIIQKSHAMSMLQEGLSGIPVIRQYRQARSFEHRICDALDTMNCCVILTAASQGCLVTFLNIINVLLNMATGILVMSPTSHVSPSVAGVVLASTLNTLFSTRLATKCYHDIETTMHAVERVHHYGTEVPQEASAFTHHDSELSETWPGQGNIIFDAIDLKYASNLPKVLESFSLNIKQCEKIGIVGRTGAGKSSLITALFRIVELEGGRIIIDGEDISGLGLETLRSRLSIVPQDPLLFKGDVRRNLDPFNKHTDQELFYVLCQTKLASATNIARDQIVYSGVLLSDPVDTHGENLSLGQRQQLSLARALLSRSKIVVLDEATSSLDLQLDMDIQSKLDRLFKNKTVISIAHRIPTVLGFDRIVVLDQGRAVEVGTPQELFDKKGLFTSMCRSADIGRGAIERRLGSE